MTGQKRGLSDYGSNPGRDSNTVRNDIVAWLDAPVPLSDLLIDAGGNPDLTRYEPLSRLVVRTAFTATQASTALGLNIPHNKMRLILEGLPGWSAPRKNAVRMLGVQHRWWLREGYEWLPGFVDADDFDSGMNLI